MSEREDVESYLFNLEKHWSGCGVDIATWPERLGAKLNDTWRGILEMMSMSPDMGYNNIKAKMLVIGSLAPRAAGVEMFRLLFDKVPNIPAMDMHTRLFRIAHRTF